MRASIVGSCGSVVVGCAVQGIDNPEEISYAGLFENWTNGGGIFQIAYLVFQYVDNVAFFHFGLSEIVYVLAHRVVFHVTQRVSFFGVFTRTDCSTSSSSFFVFVELGIFFGLFGRCYSASKSGRRKEIEGS